MLGRLWGNQHPWVGMREKMTGLSCLRNQNSQRMHVVCSTPILTLTPAGGCGAIAHLRTGTWLRSLAAASTWLEGFAGLSGSHSRLSGFQRLISHQLFVERPAPPGLLQAAVSGILDLFSFRASGPIILPQGPAIFMFSQGILNSSWQSDSESTVVLAASAYKRIRRVKCGSK